MLLFPLPLLVLGFLVLTPRYKEKPSQLKYYMLLSSLAILLFTGLRSRYLGSPDTAAYAGFFELSHGISLKTAFFRNEISSFFDFLTGEGSFALFSWVLAQLFRDGQALILASSAVVTACTSVFIAKHSKEPAFSFIVYICLGLMTFNMNGMRQAMAMSICLLAYGFAKERKPLRFLLIVLLAFTFHRTAVVFLLAYPLSHYKPSPRRNTLLAGAVLLFLLFSRRLAALYDSWVGKDYASGESFEGGGIVVVLTYLLLLGIGAFCVYAARGERGRTLLPLVLLLATGFLFYLARYFSTQIYERASYYFFYFALLLMPELTEGFEEKSRTVYLFGATLFSILLFYYRVMGGPFAHFTFFW